MSDTRNATTSVAPDINCMSCNPTTTGLFVLSEGQPGCKPDNSPATASVAPDRNCMSTNMVATGPFLCRRGRRERGRACCLSDTRHATSSVAPDHNCMSSSPTATRLFCSVGGGTGRGGGPVASLTTSPQLQASHPTATACPTIVMQLHVFLTWLQSGFCFVGGTSRRWDQLHVPQ